MLENSGVTVCGRLKYYYYKTLVTTMSSPLFETITGPLELVWDAFIEEDPRATIMLEDLTEVLDSIVLQTAADGRITVFIQESKVNFTMQEICTSFVSYFSHFESPFTIQVDDGEPIVMNLSDEEINIPYFTTSIVIEFLGMINAKATFILIADPSNVPVVVEYPLVCLGFPAPDVLQKNVRNYVEFEINREFPVLKFTPIVEHRVKLEQRNKIFQVNCIKTRKNLKKRISDIKSSLQSRQRQFSLLKENAEASVAEPISFEKKVRPDTEESIQLIERSLDRLADIVTPLKIILDEKRSIKYYTRERELELLEKLRNEVQSGREHINALIDMK